MSSTHFSATKVNAKGFSLFTFILLFLHANLCFSQYTLKTYANYDPVQRKVISTEHFNIVYPSSGLKFAKKVAISVEDMYEAYVRLLNFESTEKITIYVNSKKKFISKMRALNRSELIPLWEKSAFFKCFNGNRPEWKYLLRYEIANVFLQKIQSSKLGLFQAFLLSNPSVPLWSAGMPVYLSVPFLTKCDVRFLKEFWNVEKRAMNKTMYSKSYGKVILGRSQVHFFNKMFSADLLKRLYSTYKSFLGIQYYDFNYAFLKTFGVPYTFFYNQWKGRQFEIYNKKELSPDIRRANPDSSRAAQALDELKDEEFEPEPYRSFLHIQIKPPIVLPYYLNTDDWGVGGLVQWKSPLRLHKFLFAGILSIPDVDDKSFFYTSYVNNSFGPRIKLAFKHYTSASGWLDLTVKYSTIGALSSLWRIDAISREYSNWYMGFMLRQMQVDYFSHSLQTNNSSEIIFDNTFTAQTDLRLVFAWRKLLPSAHNAIHPLNGHGFRVSITGSGPFLNKQTQYVRFYTEAFTLVPTFDKQRLYLYTAAAFDVDEPIGADYLYFADEGGYEFPEPDIMGSVGRAVEGYVRGYKYSIAGERFAMGTVEYRIPLILNSNRLFGVLPLPKMALGLFFEGGVIGNARSPAEKGFTEYRYSLGAEIKTALSFEGYSVVFNAGVAQALDQAFGPIIYFNIQPAIPF